MDQATILILDVGSNVSTSDEKNKKSFFEKAKECVTRVIERRIMSVDKNLVGVILLGSKESSTNKTAEQCAFQHIEILAELQSPTWKMIRNLPEQPSKSRGDWVEALVVAANHLKKQLTKVKVKTKAVILLTNFMSPTCLDENHIEKTLHDFKEENIELDIIGPDIYDESLRSRDIELAQKFVEISNGATANFENAMRYLLFHKKRVVNAEPWDTDLSIGPNIKIPITSYIRIKDEPALKTSKDKRSEGKQVHVNSETQEIVGSDSVIKGYFYGQKIIPFPDTNSLFKPEVKSPMLYGFTDASNINWQALTGNSLAYIFGKKGDKKAKLAIRCLTECLHEMSLVGIVRCVYKKSKILKIFALLPVIDTNNYICLSMISLCYKDDIKYMAFPPTNLKRYACNQEQVNAFKDLIKAMDLMNAYDDTYEDTEAFTIAETANPSVQYVLDCIAFRAMNPGKPLPEPREEIMILFKVPPLVEKRSREPIEKLKGLFTLTKVDVQTKDSKKTEQEYDTDVLNQTLNSMSNHPKDEDIFTIQLPTSMESNTIMKVGTIDPVNDFKILIGNGKSLVDVAPQMTGAIENLVDCNFDGTYTKALGAINIFRQEFVNTNPAPYNNWLQNYKKELKDRNKDDVLNLLNVGQLNFILKSENGSRHLRTLIVMKGSCMKLT